MSAISTVVYIVDDEPEVRRALARLLRAAGYTTHSFGSASEFLACGEGRLSAGCIILDLAMPRMDGREWLRWFRSLRRELPVIVITAYKLDPNDAELKPAVILEKPFHVAELLDLVGLFCGLSWPMEPAKA